ncbi:MAG: hybrid sensor histidine kinase/response regulator [Planctomycetaceae bacterium]|nr:hybrid sensor histidine kinase/response regulator [Planctomycetaceae bacterium]MCB9951236.1 hybrid sensor histidine kinase/response regulator [Planctomycetaceae bacterium]
MSDRRHVLYVDDEEANLIVFELAFEDVFEVHTATSAAEALEIIERIPIPVVVADQRMPEMTGVEMFMRLRAKYPHIQRIILSGYSDSDAIIDAVNQGQVFQFLKKPWSQVELQTVLKRAIDAHDLIVQNSVLTERIVMAERTASLGKAAAEIAHEMGNQLNLLPLVEVIEDEYADDEQLVELADMARQTHDRLSRLINEIKNFVRRDSTPNAAVAGHTHHIDLGQCVRELMSFLRFHRSIPTDSVQLKLNVSKAPICGDPFKLQQVLVNLLANAAHAIEDRADGRIELKLEHSNEAFHLSVSDNGCGIPKEVLPHIWEPFFSTKGNVGTGLGLDVVRNIVVAHGGVIHCESLPNQGTTFTIDLPIHEHEPSQSHILEDETVELSIGDTRIMKVEERARLGD